MTHYHWKGILLHAIKEFASEYHILREEDAVAAQEQLEDVAQCFLGDHPSLDLQDIHNYQYDPKAEFYCDLLEYLERPDLDIRDQAIVAHCGWIRRHGDPRSVLTPLSILVRNAEIPAELRSTAAYELAQAERKLQHNDKAIEWLRISAADADEAGNRLQSLMNQAVAASWEAETDPESAEPKIRELWEEFSVLSEDPSNHDTAQRWVMNTTYDLAKIAAKNGDKDELYLCLDELEKPEYRERKWITDDQLKALRAAL